MPRHIRSMCPRAARRPPPRRSLRKFHIVRARSEHVMRCKTVLWPLEHTGLPSNLAPAAPGAARLEASRPNGGAAVPRTSHLRRNVVALAALGAFVLAVVWWRNRNLGPVEIISCRNCLNQIMVALSEYVDEHGAFPYASNGPRIVDPLVLVPDCVQLEGNMCRRCALLDGDRIRDRGYRMFNLSRAEWDTVISRLTREREAIDPTADAASLPGLPIVSCAQPVHGGRRQVGYVDCALPDGPLWSRLWSGRAGVLMDEHAFSDLVDRMVQTATRAKPPP